MAPQAPHVNHLLFAVGILVFFKGNGDGAREVHQVLDIYCQGSGQRINNDKASIYFSKSCPGHIRDEVKGIIQVQNETLNAKYLGMPSQVGVSKNGVQIPHRFSME